MTASPPPNSYDVVPYPRLTHFFTHPDRACTLAQLMGLEPAPVEHCSLLEIGGASGGNIIPMALAFPESTFTGIDFSEREINEGLADVQAMGVKNVRLLQYDILDIDESFGKFDYIIAHGVYSWVPPVVRDKLLAVYDQNLAPNGVAFVSYNVYPGWHIIDVIRQMMLFHTRQETDLMARATHAKELLEFLANAVPGDSPYGANLRAHNEYISKDIGPTPALNKSLLVHDHLSENNDPTYFYQFVEKISAHNLQYLCDADFRTDFLSGFKPENAEALLKMSHDLIELEQYMDFLRNRQFRRSLLVHKDLEINRQLKIERLSDLWIGSYTKPESKEIDLDTSAPEKFQGRDGSVLTLSQPLSKAAMVCLARHWPEYIPFDILAAEAQNLLLDRDGEPAQPETSPADDASLPQQINTLATDLLQAFTYSDNLVEFHSCAPRFTIHIGEKPLASPWARLESDTTNWVTNLRHELVELDPYEVFLLRLLDGTRDRTAILAGLEKPVRDGEILVREDQQPVTDPNHQMEVVSAVLNTKLEHLARAALLVLR